VIPTRADTHSSIERNGMELLELGVLGARRSKFFMTSGDFCYTRILYYIRLCGAYGHMAVYRFMRVDQKYTKYKQIGNGTVYSLLSPLQF